MNLAMNENRIYLVSVFLFFLFSRLFLFLFRRIGNTITLALAVASLLTILGTMTMDRTELWSSALSLWGDAVEKAPQNRFAHCNYADALYKEGRIDAGLWHCEKALSIFPIKRPELWAKQARFHLQKRNTLLARQYIEAAMKLESKQQEELIYLRAKTLFYENNSKAAIELLESLAGASDRRIRKIAKQTSKRIGEYIRKLQARLEGAKSRIAKAKILTRLGRFQEALQAIDGIKAPELEGELYLRLGKYERAIEAFEKADFPLVAERLILALVLSGQEKEGSKAARKALSDGLALGLQARFYACLPPYDPCG